MTAVGSTPVRYVLLLPRSSMWELGFQRASPHSLPLIFPNSGGLRREGEADRLGGGDNRRSWLELVTTCGRGEGKKEVAAGGRVVGGGHARRKNARRAESRRCAFHEDSRALAASTKK